ncbi:MAG: ceramidase domain-containing protein, partial [Pseudomonadota bacterium]
MDLTRRIDGYCERMSEAFFAEPLNAVTNIAFLIAAYLAYRLAKQLDRLDVTIGFLLVNLTAIGIGSTLFHTFATVWAAMTDTLPILIFILAYFAISMRRYVGLSIVNCAVATILLMFGFVGLSTIFRILLFDLVGGSVSYFPALVMLLGVGAWLIWKNHPAGPGLIVGGVIFAFSLTARAMDNPVCAHFTLGTHFIW